jgi:hypothetical protein
MQANRAPIRVDAWGPARHHAGLAMPAFNVSPETSIGEALSWDANRDERGDLLDGSQAYTIHFALGKEPPARGYWVLALFNHLNLAAGNPINRYSLGDRNSLWFNGDGSLDL